MAMEIKDVLLIGGGSLLLTVLLVTGHEEWRARHRLIQRLRRLFRVHPKSLPIVTRQFPVSDLPNLQRALTRFAEHDRVTYSVVGFNGYSLRYMSSNIPLGQAPKLAALQYIDVDVGVDEEMQCIANGLHLIDGPDGRFAIFVAAGNAQDTGSISVEVMSTSSGASAKFISQLREEAANSSVYRGQVISLEERTVDGAERGFVNVRFHPLPRVSRDSIVLPPETLALIERNCIGFFAHAERLRKSGRSLKRGILLHGEPGTGKTLTAKWLSSSLERVTVILLSGEQLWHVKECCQMARLLAPSLVILEDVDLIAEERQASSHHTALHQLLNEMDGLEADAEVIFLLTTNRPEIIEPALAGRPGRVDQAIHFPLPDADCRARLFALYGEGLDLTAVDVERFVRQTDGASPAFIKELIRKAALVAAEQSPDESGGLSLNNGCLEESLRELTIGGGQLSRQFLGFHASGLDEQE